MHNSSSTLNPPAFAIGKTFSNNSDNHNSQTKLPISGQKMTTPYPELYTKSSRVWIKHPEEVWQCGEIARTFDKSLGKLYVIVDNTEEELCIDVKENTDLPPLRNPDILIGANDLTSLSYLHEPSVLYNLRVRFLQHNSIYTWCGIVLVAINPFCDLEIYGEETIQTYHSNYALNQLDPHIYAVAEDAFTKLERNETNQSVIVSGESGAGKTVSAKFAMRYFASIAGSGSNIESRVLASNPIMEAIGNAKTVRNDNSSRFGKYIQILFDKNSRAIMGGNMRTYLLEKSRVTYQGPGERNFHIFYQICDYAKKNNLSHLGLDKWDFTYLGSGEKSQYDDMTKFIEAMDTLGFKEQQKNMIYAIIAAILHGGNIDFRAIDDERCEIHSESEQNFKLFCQLLALNESATRQWLTHRLLTSGRELITTPLSVQSAQYGKEALLKFIYDKLFSWIVMLINYALGPTAALNEFNFIGVLDIYGFEHFEINSFEQFCINYANEVLQQQFTLHVFKLEQEEYIREGIEWQFITFNDNQQVIDLIEAKPIGILSLLDEECRMPRGSDENWCTKLYQRLTNGEIFKKPKFGYQRSFIIQHFADTVVYTIDGFMEKNRDTILEEHIDLLKRSDVAEALFFEEPTVGTEVDRKGAGGKIKVQAVSEAQRNAQTKKKAKATVGSQFRESLEALMMILNSTEPHYVRCIKPNDFKEAFVFENLRAVQQLRACGVLETIRISSNGFPSRWSYPDFANRYRVLRVGHNDRLIKQDSSDSSVTKITPRKLVRAGSNQTHEIKQICEDIVKIVYEEKLYLHFNLQKAEASTNATAVTAITSVAGIQAELEKQRQLYQFGKNKIFFRPGQVALLERIRAQKLRECSILMQRNVRGWLARNRYQKIRKAALQIQCLGRAFIARKQYRHLRETKAATKIQKVWKGFIQRNKYIKQQKAILALQTRIRGYLARKKFQATRQNLASIVIQRYWRGFYARKVFHAHIKKVIIVQCCIRRFLARRKLKKLRIEARSVEHVQNLNRGLENKIIELQQKIDELQNEQKALKNKQILHETLKSEYSQLSDKLSYITAKEKQDQEYNIKLKSELQQMQKTNQELMNKVQNLNLKNSQLEEKLITSVEDMRKSQLDSKAIEHAVKIKEEELQAQFEKEKKSLIAEKEKEQIAKQQLLSRVMDLESSQMMEISQIERGPVVVVPPLQHSKGINPEPLSSTPEKEFTGTEVDLRDFDTNLGQITLSMRCTELEHENDKLKDDVKKLRKQLAKSIDQNQPDSTGSELEKSNAGAALLQEQFTDLQEELERYKKERADLKRVILIEDWITTSNPGNSEEKYQNNLVAAYKSLYTQLDEQIRKKDQIIQKQKNEIIFLRCNSGTIKGPMSITSGNSSYLSFDPHSLENMEIDTSVCYRGMFKFKQFDIDFIVRFLVYDVGPQNSFKCDAQTVSYIIYMCIRYIDYINNEDMVQRFMTELIGNIKKKAQSASTKNALESIVHVLSVAFKLATLLKYYSEYDIDQLKKDDEACFSLKENDNEIDEDFDYSQSLKNFDLTDYTKILRDLIIWIYLKLVKMFQARINNLIVPALLEHEELASSGMYVQKSINRSGSISERDTPSPTEKEIHTLIKEMSNIETMFRMHKLDDEFVYQFFKQIYYFIGTVSMNNLLMRKDLCNNNKAMQIIYNISNMEQFIREHNIPNREDVKAQMNGISQASKLLITNKTDKQITAIIQTTDALSIQQILKLLNMYTASDEEQISSEFIKQLTLALKKDRQERKDDSKSKNIVMQTQIIFPLIIPYIDENETLPINQLTKPSNVAVVAGLKMNLKEVELPVLLKGLHRHLEKI